MALEPAFLAVLDAAADAAGLSFAALAARIDRERDPSVPLASALRVAALEHAARGGARA